MKFKIDHTSQSPLYRQVVDAVKAAVKSGAANSGDIMPSLNVFARENGVSMETAKKAYNVLKKEGLLRGRQGKGYFIDVRSSDMPMKILMLVDKLSAYKLAIHKGLCDALERPADITITIHNQNFGMFEKMVADSAGEYDYYLVAAHFPAGTPNSKVARVLKRLPNDRLILIDNNIPEVKGKIGRICQDFRNDAAQALREALPQIRRYRRVVIISSASSLYGAQIHPGISKFLRGEKIKYSIRDSFMPQDMTCGTLFIVLGGQLGTEHFTILREATAQGLTLGKDIGIVSYNDEPVNEFICGGLSCISSNFEQIGREAAAMINSGRFLSIHAPFSLILRKTL